MSMRFDTDFDGGNALPLEMCPTNRPVVRFAAEPRNCPEAMWFHFRLHDLDAQAVRCILANPEQTLGGPDWSQNRPVYRPGGGEWLRTGPAVRVERPDGRVEWAWDLPVRGGSLEFAHCFPYQRADLDSTLAECGETFDREFLGLSLGGRRLIRLSSISPAPDAPAVCLLARNHAGETPGFWLLDGLLRHVAAHRDLADGIAWYAVPFVNLDDVVTGSYGKDPAPHDCNRSFGPGGPRRPEAGCIMADILRLTGLRPVAFLCDLHAPSHREQACYVPLRGWDPDSPINPIGEQFARRYHAAVPEEIRSPVASRTPAKTSVTRHVGLTAARWATEQMHLDAATLETSYQGNGRKWYTIDDYRLMGAALAGTLAGWARDRRA